MKNPNTSNSCNNTPKPQPEIQPTTNESTVNLQSLLDSVKSGNRIPAFDVDNTLSLANKGFNVFEYIFRDNTDTITDNDLQCYFCTHDIKHKDKTYFTLNLKQIALNYPEYEAITNSLQESITAIDLNEDFTLAGISSHFIKLVSTLRTKVIDLRKKSEELPNDLFIAPLAKEFLNQVKEGKQNKVIIASVAFCQYNEDNIKNVLSLIYEKAFGTRENCTIYFPKNNRTTWHKFTNGEITNTGLAVEMTRMELGGSMMSKSESLKSLSEKEWNYRTRILHLENEMVGEKQIAVEFFHFPHKQEPELEANNPNTELKLRNQPMPSAKYSEDILTQSAVEPMMNKSLLEQDGIHKRGTINKTKADVEKNPRNQMRLNNQNQSKGYFERFMNCLPSFSSCCGDTNIIAEENEYLTNQRTEQQIQPRTTLELTKINQMELKQFAPPYRNVVSL